MAAKQLSAFLKNDGSEVVPVNYLAAVPLI